MAHNGGNDASNDIIIKIIQHLVEDNPLGAQVFITDVFKILDGDSAENWENVGLFATFVELVKRFFFFFCYYYFICGIFFFILPILIFFFFFFREDFARTFLKHLGFSRFLDVYLNASIMLMGDQSKVCSPFLFSCPSFSYFLFFFKTNKQQKNRNLGSAKTRIMPFLSTRGRLIPIPLEMKKIMEVKKTKPLRLPLVVPKCPLSSMIYPFSFLLLFFSFFLLILFLTCFEKGTSWDETKRIRGGNFSIGAKRRVCERRRENQIERFSRLLFSVVKI